MRSFPCIISVIVWIVFPFSDSPLIAMAEEPSPPIANQFSHKDDEAPILITFEELKHERRDKIAATAPKDVRDWNRRLVSIEGYMLPPDKLTVKKFVLEATPIMDPHIKPLADAQVIVTCDDTAFTIRPIRVTGRFSIEEFKAEGTDMVYAIYKIDDAKVEIVKNEEYACVNLLFYS